MDKDLLEKDAMRGLPVSGRSPTWESDRPTILEEGTAGKLRGFVEYERSPLPYRPEAERLEDWKEVHTT